jgi:hypothetical protein
MLNPTPLLNSTGLFSEGLEKAAKLIEEIATSAPVEMSRRQRTKKTSPITQIQLHQNPPLKRKPALLADLIPVSRSYRLLIPHIQMIHVGFEPTLN